MIDRKKYITSVYLRSSTECCTSNRCLLYLVFFRVLLYIFRDIRTAATTTKQFYFVIFFWFLLKIVSRIQLTRFIARSAIIHCNINFILILLYYCYSVIYINSLSKRIIQFYQWFIETALVHGYTLRNIKLYKVFRSYIIYFYSYNFFFIKLYKSDSILCTIILS